jgi:hypothetical protein
MPEKKVKCENKAAERDDEELDMSELFKIFEPDNGKE